MNEQEVRERFLCLTQIDNHAQKSKDEGRPTVCKEFLLETNPIFSNTKKWDVFATKILAWEWLSYHYCTKIRTDEIRAWKMFVQTALKHGVEISWATEFWEKVTFPKLGNPFVHTLRGKWWHFHSFLDSYLALGTSWRFNLRFWICPNFLRLSNFIANPDHSMLQYIWEWLNNCLSYP